MVNDLCKGHKATGKKRCDSYSDFFLYSPTLGKIYLWEVKKIRFRTKKGGCREKARIPAGLLNVLWIRPKER